MKNLVEPIPMREAVINAIVHSDFSREIPPVFEIFSDRMVFTSYGGLIPGQIEQDFLVAAVCHETVSLCVCSKMSDW